jgi:hypothetical protein
MPGELLALLDSEDPVHRLAAVVAACPCRRGLPEFAALVEAVMSLRKDPDRAVREAAAHAMEEWGEMSDEGLPTSRRELTDDFALRRRKQRLPPMEQPLSTGGRGNAHRRGRERPR